MSSPLSDRPLPQRRHSYRGLAIVLWSMALLASALMSSCEKDIAAVQRNISEEDLGKETATEVVLYYSDSAIVRIQVESPLMVRYTDKNQPRQVFPQGLTVRFFGPNLQTSSILTAGYGIRLEREARVILRDSVVWSSVEGEQLETEELIWDEQEALIYTDKFVVIRRPGEIIYGYGFEATQDFDQARIKAIEGRVQVVPPAPADAPKRQPTRKQSGKAMQ